MSDHQHSDDAVRLVADTIAAQARKAPVTARDPYSWGIGRLFAPTTRDVAVAVLDALARSGRLLNARELASFGVACLCTGVLLGMVFALAAMADMSWWIAVPVGFLAGSGAARLIRRAARKLADRGVSRD